MRYTSNGGWGKKIKKLAETERKQKNIPDQQHFTNYQVNLINIHLLHLQFSNPLTDRQTEHDVRWNTHLSSTSAAAGQVLVSEVCSNHTRMSNSTSDAGRNKHH